MPRIALILIPLVLFSCMMETRDIEVNNYYPLDSLIDAQTALLASDRLRLVKRVSLNGQLTTHTLKPDSVQWRKELDVLKQINPNTPKYVNAFVTSERKTLLGKKWIYKLKKGESAPLKILDLEYEQGELSALRAELHIHTPIQRDRKWFNLRFRNGRLEEYQIVGGKKQIFTDSTHFSILGRIEAF